MPSYGIGGGGGGQDPLDLKLTQINETVYVPEFEQTKVISLYPQMGKSNIMQYSLEGNFNMLPLKMYPTFVSRQEFYKLDLTLKANCRLPTNLRIKDLKVRFRVPDTVTKVFIHEKNMPPIPQSQNVQHWQDINSLGSIASYASSFVESAQIINRQTQPEENDIADYNSSKRRIEWHVKNFRG